MKLKLMNGRGQIGQILSKKIENLECKSEILLYHTWNIDDKSEEAQLAEYVKFVNFVDNNKNKRIIFISTKSEKDSWYVYYKQMSESYLLQNSKDCLILRFPTIVGSKGTILLLKQKKIQPYGIMELMSLEEVATKIIDTINYNGKSKILSFEGQKISAVLANEILKI
jgi:hypothetical protein